MPFIPIFPFFFIFLLNSHITLPPSFFLCLFSVFMHLSHASSPPYLLFFFFIFFLHLSHLPMPVPLYFFPYLSFSSAFFSLFSSIFLHSSSFSISNCPSNFSFPSHFHLPYTLSVFCSCISYYSSPTFYMQTRERKTGRKKRGKKRKTEARQANYSPFHDPSAGWHLLAVGEGVRCPLWR